MSSRALDEAMGGAAGHVAAAGKGTATGRSLDEFRTESTRSGLLPAEDRLLEAAAAGEACWLVEEQFIPLVEKGEACLLARPATEPSSRDVRVRGKFLRFLALGGDGRHAVHERGIKLVGAHVTGAFDIAYCEVKFPLEVACCWFDQIVTLRGARLSTVNLSGSRTPGLNAAEAKVAGGVILSAGFRSDGGASLQDVTIDGTLRCEGGRFAKDQRGWALIAQCARIGGHVLLRNGFRSEGIVSLQAADIGGTLDCSAGTFLNRTPAGDGIALDATSAKIKVNVVMGEGFRAEGAVTLLGCDIGGSLECGSAQPIARPVPEGTYAPRRGACFLNQRGKEAVNANNLRVKGNVLLLHGVRVLGQWSMQGTEIAGYFQCLGTRFLNRTPDGQGVALTAAVSKIKHVMLTGGVRILGCASFHGAEIGGSLDCTGIHIANRAPGGAGIAIEASLAKIKGGVLLYYAECAGRTHLLNAEISGDLHLGRGRFANPTADGQGVAVDASCALIGGNALLHDLQAIGQVSLMSARISRQLVCSGSCFSNPVPAMHQPKGGRGSQLELAEFALQLQDVVVGDILFLGPPVNFPDSQVVIEGSLSLFGAHARHYQDHHKSWPQPTIKTADGRELLTQIDLEGFTYDRLTRSTPIAYRKVWLRRRAPDELGNRFTPHPFEQLTKVLRAMGQEEEARIVAQDKQDFRRELKLAPPGWGLYRSCVGYGYRPGRLVGMLFVMWLVCALYYWQAWREDLFVPSQTEMFLAHDVARKCRPPQGRWTTPECARQMVEYPAFNALIYSLDLMLPVLDLRQKHSWAPTSELMTIALPGLQGIPTAGPQAVTLPRYWVPWVVVWIQTIFGWIGSLLLIAVLTGILKKD
jgi:hypothetical protein